MMSGFRRLVTRMAVFSAQHAPVTLLLVLFVSLSALFITAQNLKFNSDKESLVAETAAFKQRNAQFDAAFPQFSNSLLIVVDAPDAAQSRLMAEKIVVRLALDPDRFRNAFFAEGDAFFQQNGLLYLSVDELEERASLFANAEPALAAIAHDPSLRGVLDLLGLGIDALETETALPPAYETFTASFLKITKAVLENNASPGFDGFLNTGASTQAHLVSVQPALDYTSQSAERVSIQYLRALLDEAAFQQEGVRIRLTGRVALADDEISAIQDSVFLAGFLSIVFTGALLGFALRSARLIAAILITLFVGLVWTMGFAALSVGSLNMISAAVVVLFIGLGIDHSIHVSLRYREARQNGQSHIRGIETAAQEMGGAVALCVATSATGFLAFAPTQYRGLAELGIIAAGSLFLAFVTSFTVLPALLSLFGNDKTESHVPQFVGARLSGWLTGHSMRLSLAVSAAALAALLVTGAPTFDFSTLAIRDVRAESVTTLLELQERGIVTDYAADVLVKTETEAEAIALRLAALPQISDVITAHSFVPDDQALKLEILGDAQGFLWAALNAAPHEAPSDAERRQMLTAFVARATSLPASDDVVQTLKLLAATLEEIALTPDGPERLAKLERRITVPLLSDIERLRLALSAQSFTFQDLPPALQDRHIGRNGEIRVTAVSAVPLLNSDVLAEFVGAVRSVAPEATGRALTEADVGGLVVASFYQAGLIAFSGIAILLLVVLRSPVDAALVLAPLGMAACFTIASADLLGISFNFANIVVLPLIFGLGVDSGVHFVLRQRHEKSVGTVMHSSTPQAIMLSALSTIGAFAALSLSRHWGLASMGLLLTIAVFWVIVCTVIVLPALMAWREKSKSGEAPNHLAQ